MRTCIEKNSTYMQDWCVLYTRMYAYVLFFTTSCRTASVPKPIPTCDQDSPLSQRVVPGLFVPCNVSKQALAHAPCWGGLTRTFPWLCSCETFDCSFPSNTLLHCRPTGTTWPDYVQLKKKLFKRFVLSIWYESAVADSVFDVVSCTSIRNPINWSITCAWNRFARKNKPSHID